MNRNYKKSKEEDAYFSDIAKDDLKAKKKLRDVKKVRKLKDGGVAFGNTAKIGRTGLIIIPTVLVLCVVFYFGMNGYYDEFLEAQFGSNSVRGNFEVVTFNECEKIEFNSGECGIFKFCHEYEDGGSICHYHELGIHDQVEKMEGSKYLPGEQDFLPPSGFVLPLIQWADARSDSEPVCYSAACRVLQANQQPQPVITSDANELAAAEPRKLPSRGFITIGIFHSKSCDASVSVGGDCMTNRQLVELFDNTNQGISGKFVEDEFTGDLRRTAPTFGNHWDYYKNSGLRYIVAVDPDVRWYSQYMDVRVVIEPSTDFVFHDVDLQIETTKPSYYDAYDDAIIIKDDDDDVRLDPIVCFTASCKSNMQKLHPDRVVLLDSEVAEYNKAISYDESSSDDDEDEQPIVCFTTQCKNNMRSLYPNKVVLLDTEVAAYNENKQSTSSDEKINEWKEAREREKENELKALQEKWDAEKKALEERKKEQQLKDNRVSNSNEDLVICYTTACKSNMQKLFPGKTVLLDSEVADYNKAKNDVVIETSESVPRELVQFRDAYIDGCSFARIKSDPYLIADVLTYFLQDCASGGKWNPSDQVDYVPLPALPINYDDYSWYKYNAWLNKSIQECKTKC